MKPYFLILVLLLSTLCAKAQNAVALIQKSFQTGNIALLANYLSSDIEVSTPNGEATDKGNAALLLNSFLLQNVPRSFTVKHNCTAPNGSQSVVGTLGTTNGNYRVAVALKGNNIDEISIEKQ